MRVTCLLLSWKTPCTRSTRRPLISSLKVFPWARFRTTKAAVKMHTQIDLRGNIPSFIHVSDGKMHEVNVLDLIMPEARKLHHHGSWVLSDFARLYRADAGGSVLRHPSKK